MSTLYVVTCSVEGCEECGNTFGVVGVFTTRPLAEAAVKVHAMQKHLHSPYIDIHPIPSLDTMRGTNSNDYCQTF